MEVLVGAARLVLAQGDITLEETGTIVNAANTTLLGGGGVDGAIHRAGGPQILEECRAIGGCPTGDARITSGGRLKARHVIHAVGPVYRDGKRGEAALLAGAYRKSLELATKHGIRTISFPAISTGAYGYPMDEASRIALTTVRDYLREHPEFALVRFVLFGAASYATFAQVLEGLGSAARGVEGSRGEGLEHDRAYREARMSEAMEGVELKAEVGLTRQEFAHLWSGGVLALKVAGRGVEVALDVTYQEAPPTRGTRFLIKRVDLD